MRNVVVLVVDALSYPSLGCGGQTPSPSPTIDDLAAEGLSLGNCYSTGSVTQFAYPTLVTSTLPLSYGGYDRGILDRPTSLAEVFDRHGYATGAVVTAWWLDRHNGYDRGFDDFVAAFDLSMYLDGATKVYVDYVRDNYRGNERVAAARQVLVPFLERVFERVPEYCAEKQAEHSGAGLDPSPTLHAWRFTEVRRGFEVEHKAFEEDREAYVRDLVSGARESVFDRVRSERDVASPGTAIGRRFVLETAATYLRRNARNFRNADLGSPRNVAGAAYNAIWKKLSFDQQTRVPSAQYVLEHTLDWIDGADRPFFAWTHLMDVHDLNFTSWEYDDGRTDRELAAARNHLEAIRSTDGWYGNPYYEYAVRYVDDRIAWFLDALASRGLAGETVVVVCADHGHYHPERPFRPNAKIDAFYDGRYHVPLIVHNAGIDRDVDRLASTLELAPTVADTVGLAVPDSFRGESVAEDAFDGREFVLMENASHGPCDLRRKPINVAVRTPGAKVAREDGGFVRYERGGDGIERRRPSPDGAESPEGIDRLEAVVDERVRAATGAF